MPNRIVRETILDSARVDKLSWSAEVFYRRLMSIVDDFGLYDARVDLLRAKLFPLRLEKVSSSDVGKWMTECVEADLIRCYEVSEKPYLEILDFGQNVRVKKSKFPIPEIIYSQMKVNESRRMPETNTNRIHTEYESEGLDFGKMLIEDVAMIEAISISTRKSVNPLIIRDFQAHLKTEGKSHPKYHDFTTHFRNWLNRHNPVTAGAKNPLKKIEK